MAAGMRFTCKPGQYEHELRHVLLAPGVIGVFGTVFPDGVEAAGAAARPPVGLVSRPAPDLLVGVASALPGAVFGFMSWQTIRSDNDATI